VPVFRLQDDDYSFPHPSLAEREGLLAVGGDLHPERLLTAYQYGIFPWFEEDGVYFWYTPDPRCVLFPEELKVHKSMRSIFNQQRFRYSIDTCFREVMEACAQPRSDAEEPGTWIGPEFIEGYVTLHELGVAHSIEVWEGNDLVGGLYGVSLGKVFFGESMFARVPNASKAGFIHLVNALKASRFRLIDCQQRTAHLQSLGARSISRSEFLDLLEINQFERTLIGKWAFGENGIELQGE
jgi:leucyl/phenylalanyl-tRNA---protein transferase